MQNIKPIGGRYKIQKPLFKVNRYLYCKVFDKVKLETHFCCIYAYENQQPGQILNIVTEKFSMIGKVSSLIFPRSHFKDSIVGQRNHSIFFMPYRLIPINMLSHQQLSNIETPQILKIAYDAWCGLHFLHSQDIIHGKISPKTSYFSRQGKDINFALNILDTNMFYQQTVLKQGESIFKSEGQTLDFKTSYKDDAESTIYLIMYLYTKGKMFNKERYTRQWKNQTQLTRWKCCDFYKEMVEIIPKELEYLVEMFVMIKALSRNQKPDYPKYIKKAFFKLSQYNGSSSNSINMKPNISIQNLGNINKYRNNLKQKQERSQESQESSQKSQGSVEKKVMQDDIIIKFDQDQEEQPLYQKFKKLQNTKCSTKTNNFWKQNQDLQRLS